MELNRSMPKKKKTLTWDTEVKITYVKIRGVKGEDGICSKGAYYRNNTLHLNYSEFSLKWISPSTYNPYSINTIHYFLSLTQELLTQRYPRALIKVFSFCRNRKLQFEDSALKCERTIKSRHNEHFVVRKNIPRERANANAESTSSRRK